jgi:hypothetical protein
MKGKQLMLECLPIYMLQYMFCNFPHTKKDSIAWRKSHVLTYLFFGRFEVITSYKRDFSFAGILMKYPEHVLRTL